MRNPAATLFLFSSLLGGTVWSQEPLPVGGEFQVNAYTTNRQNYPAVTKAPEGNFVVVWGSVGSSGTDTSSLSIQARRYDANGTPVGVEFQVNSYTTDSQSSADAVLDPAGNLVVVWHSDGSYGSDTDRPSIQGRLYDANGAPVGAEFQVNSYTTGYQLRPDVAADAAGNFVVVWDSEGSYGNDTNYRSIQGQRYDAAGTPVGGQFQINSYTTNRQRRPAVAVDVHGNFVVVWHSNGSSGTDENCYSIQGQRYNATGTPIGGQFQINTHTTQCEENPSVAMYADGDFVVVWDSGGPLWILGQRFSAAGTRVGGEFRVNSYTGFAQQEPEVAADPEGNFVVTWHSYGSNGTDTTDKSTRGRRYDSAGSPVGTEFQVNSYTTGDQQHASVAADAVGDFVVVWDSDGSYGIDDSGKSIQGQRFSVPLFLDGFESGDTSVWSVTVPTP